LQEVPKKEGTSGVLFLLPSNPHRGGREEPTRSFLLGNGAVLGASFRKPRESEGKGTEKGNRNFNATKSRKRKNTVDRPDSVAKTKPHFRNEGKLGGERTQKKGGL